MIDLGKKMEMPTEIAAEIETEDRVVYPSLYIEGGNELKELPQEGVIKLRYKTVSKTVRERDDKKICQLELEMKEILGAKSPEELEEKREKKSRESEIDDLAKEVSEDY